MSSSAAPSRSPASVSGIAVCCGSVFLCVGYLVAGRRLGRGIGFFNYLVPMYALSGLISVGLAVTLRETLPPITPAEIGWAIGAAVVPTVIGHSAMNWCMMHMPPQTVATASLGQFIFVAILAIPFLGEWPVLALLPASVLVVAGALIVIRSNTVKSAGPRTPDTSDAIDMKGSSDPAHTSESNHDHSSGGSTASI
jgi:drug/metabolite transporter (DMT)-like permease